MNTAIVDLRSDTVTKPSAAMRRAMYEAEVGDDVYREDPTLNRLQERAAEVFAREAGLFVASGTMGNQAALKVHGKPGKEVICEARAHIYNFEMGSVAAFAGLVPRTIWAEDGILTWELIAPFVRGRGDHRARTALIELENTSNIAGGSVYPPEVFDDIADHVHAAGLPVHLDGARIFNASVAVGRPVTELTRKADSVMFCLSKALGAPVGSMLAGTRDDIDRGRLYRKRLGGGMRQAGVLAAAGLVALEEHPRLLRNDHANAKFLAHGLARIPGIALDPEKVQTNIVIFGVSGTGLSASEFSARLKAQGVLIDGIRGGKMRLVTHYDADRTACEKALEAIEQLAAGATAAAR